MPSKTSLPVIFGAMTFGREGEEQVRTSKLEDCATILDTFQSYGHSEIDTSRFYGGGSSEEYLNSLNWKKRNLTMDTKFYPNIHGILGRPVTHLAPDNMRAGLEESLKALGTESIDLWYLHAPDRSVPIQDTLKGVNELFKQGRFKRWGLSNYMAWEGLSRTHSLFFPYIRA
jgi:aflatoxin B1 aldehyde reductase